MVIYFNDVARVFFQGCGQLYSYYIIIVISFLQNNYNLPIILLATAVLQEHLNLQIKGRTGNHIASQSINVKYQIIENDT